MSKGGQQWLLNWQNLQIYDIIVFKNIGRPKTGGNLVKIWKQSQAKMINKTKSFPLPKMQSWTGEMNHKKALKEI